jgi:DNA polymerase beta
MANHKQTILDALDKLRKEELANKEIWKAKAYSTAIKELKQLDVITSANDVKNIKGIGKSILSKIEEIIETGELERLKDYNADGHIQSISDLSRIHGIGPAKAKDLVITHGIKNISELEQHQELLNEKQKIGLKYYRDIELRIPYIEMKKHDDFLKAIIKELDDELVFEIVGSYRRQMKDSGDIDILITHKADPRNNNHIIKDVVTYLKKMKYLIEDFASGEKKYLGICRLKHQRHFRRIDLLYTNADEFPFAQLYFTGSKEFNLELRNICISKKLSLSEYGLKKENGQFVDHIFRTEEDIFTYLGYKYISPKERTSFIKLSDYTLN